MLQISKIVKKTEEMFDLFNKHFYNMERQRRQVEETAPVSEPEAPTEETAEETNAPAGFGVGIHAFAWQYHKQKISAKRFSFLESEMILFSGY